MLLETQPDLLVQTYEVAIAYRKSFQKSLKQGFRQLPVEVGQKIEEIGLVL